MLRDRVRRRGCTRLLYSRLSITQSIVDTVVSRTGDARVSHVRLEVGRLSGVVVDSIRFCFDLVAEGTPLHGARLEIDEPSGEGRCRDCGTEFGVDDPIVLCGGADVAVLSGRQLRITSVEVSTACAPRAEQNVLARNDELAEHNRAWLAEREILAINLMSSPGSGKTTLLERTIRDLSGEVGLSVVEGDQETAFDTERIRATGCRAVQVNTGAGCHLDATMLATALHTLDPRARSVVFIENVGNLVCPALFDLGESCRVVIMSVTEGADKPLKYPHMFRTADLVLVNKIDLLPYVDFPLDRFGAHLRRVNADARVVRVSATRGDDIGDWYGWLRGRARLVWPRTPEVGAAPGP